MAKDKEKERGKRKGKEKKPAKKGKAPTPAPSDADIQFFRAAHKRLQRLSHQDPFEVIPFNRPLPPSPQSPTRPWWIPPFFPKGGSGPNRPGRDQGGSREPRHGGPGHRSGGAQAVPEREQEQPVTPDPRRVPAGGRR